MAATPDRAAGGGASRLHQWTERFAGTRPGSLFSAAVAGVVGHRLDGALPIVPRMSFRYGGTDADVETLYDLHVRSRGSSRPVDVAVCLHGLMTDEQNWLLGSEAVAPRLNDLFGWVPLYVRYNTGLHISENGEALARMLRDLANAWGPRLGRIQLFGHSMGGLVVRAAVAALEKRNLDPIERIERMFLLATPNQGCDLERLGHLVEYALSLAHNLRPAYRDALSHPSEARDELTSRASWGGLIGSAATAAAFVPLTSFQAIRTVIAGRSDGIRDVRFAYMQREEWMAAEQDGLRLLANHRRPLPPPPHVRVYCVAGSLWPDAGIEPSRVRNDGIIDVASAAGRGGEFDDLGAWERGRFAEIPLLLHQLVPASDRVLRAVRHWVEADI